MKKEAVSVDNFRTLYRTVGRKSLTVVAGFVIAVSAVNVTETAGVDTFRMYIDEIPMLKTQIGDYNRMPEGFLAEVEGEIVNDSYADWKREIEEISRYDQDWDGEQSEAPQKEAVDGSFKLLESTRRFTGLLSAIYATAFGSICMEWGVEDGWVNVEIAASGVAFYHDGKIAGKLYIGEYQSLDHESSNDIIRHLELLKDGLAG